MYEVVVVAEHFDVAPYGYIFHRRVADDIQCREIKRLCQDVIQPRAVVVFRAGTQLPNPVLVHLQVAFDARNAPDSLKLVDAIGKSLQQKVEAENDLLRRVAGDPVVIASFRHVAPPPVLKI